MAEMRLTVLYPYPADASQFDADYADHLRLLHQKRGIPEGDPPYMVTRFRSLGDGPPHYHLMFSMPFPSLEALQQTLGSDAMKEVAQDAARISTGGAPAFLVGGGS